LDSQIIAFPVQLSFAAWMTVYILAMSSRSIGLLCARRNRWAGSLPCSP